MWDTRRTPHYSLRTDNAYVEWIGRYIPFHNKRHSRQMGQAEVEAFLTHLAVERHVAASTRNQALSTLPPSLSSRARLRPKPDCR